MGGEAVYLAAVEAGGLRVEGQHNRANFEQGLLKVVENNTGENTSFILRIGIYKKYVKAN